jgi:UDPglucose 6-dehydrogenase
VGDGSALVKICVYGLWHLGCVTAACLARGGHEVVGLDDDDTTIATLQEGRAPLFEPGLNDLLREGLDAGRLCFTSDRNQARDAEVVWITFDTPVSEEDRADVAFVTSRIESLLPLLPSGTLVVVSSQLPVGSIRTLEEASGREDLSFAALPENLRLGKAIEVFTNPDRVVAGVRDDASRARIAAMLAPFTERIEWMSVESAEMTKHALNAFLATSVVFINEIATLCESVGADAKEVERGLKSESRIGPRAYLSPGAAFAGGTLARDITFLSDLGERLGQMPTLIAAVKTSNDLHKDWTRRKLRALPDGLRGRTVGIWGLAYKPGTDTLRRSSSVELCRWLAREGARVLAHDPAVRTLPTDLASIVDLRPSPVEAAEGVTALVVATEWPDYRAVTLAVREPLTVIDPNRFLSEQFERNDAVRYITIGKGVA